MEPISRTLKKFNFTTIFKPVKKIKNFLPSVKEKLYDKRKPDVYHGECGDTKRPINSIERKPTKIRKITTQQWQNAIKNQTTAFNISQIKIEKMHIRSAKPENIY